MFHLVALLACCNGAGDVYAWPLDLPQALTSSFAEYRERKFHAGIDLRTGDAGKDVHAAGDGYVSRVRCSPWGYGKVVYITLTDTNVAVYAHLSDFYPALRDYVYKAQHAARSYTVELTPKPGEFPITRGQLVAKSGETGAGPPHLHYEIRDAQERPFNPRLLGITWPDTIPPVIHKILVAPATPDDRVNGDILPVTLEAKTGPDGKCQTAPVTVHGAVGFGVDVIDPANDNANRLGVHVLRTVADGQEVFRIVHDRLSYDTIDSGAVSYHPFYVAQGPFLLQWRWPDNACEIFHQTKQDGWYTTPSAPVDVRIEAVDFLENSAAVTIPLKPAAPVEAPAPQGPGTGRGKARIECVGTWLAVSVEFSAPEPETPTLTLDRGEATFHRVNATTFRAGLAPDAATQELTVRVTHARMDPFEQHIDVFHRGAAEWAVTRQGVGLRVRPTSPFGTLFATVSQEAAASAPGELTTIGNVYRVWPADSPINTPVELTFPIPSGAKQAARLRVFRNTGSGWTCLESKRAGDRLTVTTQRFGAFAVMEDTQAPRINFIAPQNPKSLLGARPTLNINVSDAGSGVAEVSAMYGEQWLLMEYDPERDLAEWARDQDLPAGARAVVFRAVDRVGNAATFTYELPGAPAAKKPAKKP